MIKAMLSPSEKDGISPFRSVTMALAGTLGVGNIVGVASAIALGGFGAVFWMWISALAAMILKYAEITLALSHRRKRNGENHGGAVETASFSYIGLIEAFRCETQLRISLRLAPWIAFCSAPRRLPSAS